MSSHPDSPFASGPPGFVEQRLFVRKKVDTPLPIELVPGKEVWLHDLGEGGLSVSGSSRVELGTPTFLTFHFPDSNSMIEAAGVVAWCHSSGRLGVRFTRIKPDSTAALKRWLKSGTPQAAKPAAKVADRSPELASLVSRAESEIRELRADLASAALGDDAALKLIAERTARLTRATGAAIAWREHDDVICRASSGNAPAVGVKLNMDAGLTGECYRTGNIVSLTDSRNDSRVDPELCRQLHFRSLLIVPVVSVQEVIGVAEVFSPTAGNFEGGDVLLLSSITELIAEIYRRRERRLSPSIADVDDLLMCELEIGWQEPAHDQTLTELGISVSQSAAAEQPRQPTPTDAPQTAGDLEHPSTNQQEGTSWQARSRNYLLLILFAASGIGIGDYLNRHVALPRAEAGDRAKLTFPAELSAIPAADRYPGLAAEENVIVQTVDLKLRTLASPTASVKPAVHQQSVHSEFLTGVTPSKLVRRVNPVYPRFAKAAGIRGAVVLSGMIGKDGKLKDVKLVSGNGALALEAFRAVRQWRYTPYLVNGEPIEVQSRVVVDFNAR